MEVHQEDLRRACVRLGKVRLDKRRFFCRVLRRYTAGDERLLQDESEEPIPDWQTVERQLQSEVPPSPASHCLRLRGSAPAYDALGLMFSLVSQSAMVHMLHSRPGPNVDRSPVLLARRLTSKR